MSNDGILRIAISGRSGCGNTTVSTILSRRLGFKMVNYTFHSIADEMEMEFEAFCKLAEEDSKWDYQVDERQVELAMEGSSVLGSRLAIWMLKEADLKVFLTASPEERGRRIQKREGGTLSERMSQTAVRDERDHIRYKKLYDIDNNDFAFADLVINTDRMSPEVTADIILAAVGRN